MIQFGREICGIMNAAESREWLVTNGIGGFASGTIAGLLTRRYHGLLIAALKPPLGRTLLLSKLDETAHYQNQLFPLYTNRWISGKVEPEGYQQIEKFALEGTIPMWRFACGDAVLEKRIWMQQGENTTYIQYTLHRATHPLTLTIKAFVNYRDYHSNTHATNWNSSVSFLSNGVCIQPFPEAIPLYLFAKPIGDHKIIFSAPTQPCWYYGFELALEHYRGLDDSEDHLHAVTFHCTLDVGRSLTLVASTHANPNLNGEVALQQQRSYEQQLLESPQLLLSKKKQLLEPPLTKGDLGGKSCPQPQTPDWVRQLLLAANQFIVRRPTAEQPDGKTIIAGYPWFGDWGRDTMIALPGLTLTTGHPEVARSILATFAQYVDQGMLPNRFPDVGDTPDYNTLDATLWYFEAIRAYFEFTEDKTLLHQVFPILQEIITWHQQGTRYNIHLDPEDGLMYGGEFGTQLTWMDAKVGDWVVTPRMGKPIEINALWYNALQAMIRFAQHLGKSAQIYEQLAEKTALGFQRFWNEKLGYCYDVIDTPNGSDPTLRPNQIFAISLPPIGQWNYPSLLTPQQQKQVIDICSQTLLTSYGLRSLALTDPNYQGIYGGNQVRRDGAYHQGTVWGWLIGPFVLAHWRVYQDAVQAREFLQPMADHLLFQGIGTLAEIFDGNPPFYPRGCIAQAWTVAEVLRAWFLLEKMD